MTRSVLALALAWLALLVGCGSRSAGAIDAAVDGPATVKPDAAALDLASPDGSALDAGAELALDAPILDAEVDSPFVDLPHADQQIDAPAPDLLLPDAAAPPDLPLPDGPGPGIGPFVSLKKGTFMIGSPKSEPCRLIGSAEEQHKVTLTNDFELLATEVTQRQYQTLMGYNNAFHKSCGPTCPVETVDWHEAAAFTNALSAKAGLTSCYACKGKGPSVICQAAAGFGGKKIYTCPGYRLPTEAEWEYAYRAGTTTAYYSGANNAKTCSTIWQLDLNADKIGWYHANSWQLNPRPVAKKQQNAWGIYDMAGNVAEWCHDSFDMYLGSKAQIDPCFTTTSWLSRAVRNGSYGSPAHMLRAASRWYQDSIDSVFWVGFRVARTK